MNKTAALFLSLALLTVAAIACTRSDPTPTEAPAEQPTQVPTEAATARPTPVPTLAPTAAPTPTAGPSLGDTRTRSIDGMAMVYVPAGEFQMGSTDEQADYAGELCDEPYADCQREWFGREQPAHVVALDGFWFDRTEVTNDQFVAFLKAEGNQEDGGVPWMRVEHDLSLVEHVGDEYLPKSGYADHPAIMVTWYGAAAYCEWAGGRLPTEAEWEYAARGPEGRMLPWGDDLDGTQLNYCDAGCELNWADESFNDGYARTAPVGSYPEGASWCEALDTAGNVGEWTADWYGEYTSAQQENPKGPEYGEDRVVRGGSWHYRWNHVRTAARLDLMPTAHSGDVGFRCAVSSSE